jgi:hypothetical protein
MDADLERDQFEIDQLRRATGESPFVRRMRTTGKPR